jgi:hypothetical protein
VNGKKEAKSKARKRRSVQKPKKKTWKAEGRKKSGSTGGVYREKEVRQKENGEDVGSG